MSLKWPVKDPDETLDFSLDWSRFLEGQSISAVNWYVYDADGVKTLAEIGTPINSLTLTGVATTTTVTTANFAGGISGLEYKIACQVTFGASSLVAERTIRLPVRNR